MEALTFKGSQRMGVEFKRADVPKVTKSMHIAIKDLKLDALYIVYPGEHRFYLELSTAISKRHAHLASKIKSIAHRLRVSQAFACNVIRRTVGRRGDRDR